MKAPIPHNEQERLQALHRCQLLDTPPEEAYDRLTRMAAQIFSTPIAAICLIAEDRQFLKSTVGLNVRETERDISFCAHTILQEEPVVVPDTRLDPRFSDNPLVAGEPGIRFYCGAPLKTPDGFLIGAICVADTEPRAEVSEGLVRLLRELAAQASTEIRHRQEGLRLASTSTALQERDQELAREKQLRYNSEIRAELALEAGNMGSWEWDAVSRRVVFSPVMQRLFGYTGADGARHFKWLQRIHPEDRKPLARAMRTAYDEGDGFDVEFRAISTGGSVRWLALKGRYRRGCDGKLAGANGVCWDVTDRREAEECVRASEEVFRGISVSSPVGIFRADLNGNVCYVNPRGQEIWAMTESEILGLGWTSRLHPEDAHSLMSGWVGANAKGQSYQQEFRLLFPDGTVRWVYGRSSIVHDRNGIPIGTVGTVDDITERKRLEEERHASQELTRRILESSADCIKVLDLEGRLLLVSPGGQHAFGIADIQPYIGREYFSLWENQRDREASKAAFRTAVAGGIGSFQGFLSPRGDDDVRWWDTVFSPITDRTGKPERILAVSRDLTELRRASIEQEKARELAEEANRAKSLFLANVSHELRTPLNGMLGMADLLLGSALNGEQRELAETVKQSGAALLALVNDLLDLSRVETGKLDYQRTAFDLRNTVNQAVALVASTARQKGLELTVGYPDSLPRLLVGDENRIRQIVINYLNNAVKFTDEGRVSVEVRAEPSENAAAEFLITVRDTGRGIPAEAQADLFTPFRQADPSSTRKHGGLGLGLAISKRIAEAMGGSVGLMSSPGKGSTFWVKLPLTLAGKCVNNQLGEQGTARSVTALDSPRVLVAEDNAINQKVILRFLAKLGCVPEVASDGAAAVRLFEQNTYDLVLMDCQMPELDGYQAAERIRQWESDRRGKRTPIIAVTAHAMVGDRERCLQAGMDDYLPKPLSLESLKNMLARWKAAPGVH